MFRNYKKILLIIGFLIIVIILGWIIYAVFFKSATQPAGITDIKPGTQGELPTAKEGSGQIVSPDEQYPLPSEQQKTKQPDSKALGGLTQTTELSQTSSLFPILSNDGSSLQYYSDQDGMFYRIEENGKATALNDKIFHNVQNITWSPDSNKAILEYPDGANIVYDFSTNKQVTLPKHWEDFDFAPNSKQIVMKSIGLDPNNRWLAISNADGSQSKTIEFIGENADTVYPSWSPNNQSIAMYTKGVDFNQQEVFYVGLHDENFKSTIIEGRDFRYKWAPSGDKMLYSVYSTDNDLKPMLWTVNAQGDTIGSNRKSLKIETWADKCVFANSNDLYCAVPKTLEQGAGLFTELAKNTPDTLYKIDIRTGFKKLIAVPDQEFNMSNLIISKDNVNLYFTDNRTKKLHKIQLK